MKITCVGGGPGGLFFAALMAQRDPSHEVTVLERDPQGATFGFGVVFSESTLGGLGQADPILDQRLAAIGVHWTDIEVRHRGQRIRAGGNGFAAASRRQLLSVLQQRAVESGVDVRYGERVEDYAELMASNDLVVGCEGLSSGARERFAHAFGPTVDEGAAKYIWFATPQPFDALTFIFVESEHGWFGAHAYPFEDGTSTFIVECDEASWRRAGLDSTDEAQLPAGASDSTAMAHVTELFAESLGGHGLIGNNSRWANFRTVRNEAWHHDNLVLIGDAAHTAHFSVGSGTKMAMEDAVALAAVFDGSSSMEQALGEYQAARRPGVERIQNAAHPSLAWWERFARWTEFEPEQFTYHFLTRSQRVRHENLRMRDRRLVARVEHWYARRNTGMDPELGPLSAPLVDQRLPLPNRVMVDVEVSGDVDADRTEAVCAAVGPAWDGAGAVCVHGSGWSTRSETTELWVHIRALIARRSAARLAVAVPAGLAAESLAEVAEVARLAGVDILQLAGVAVDDPLRSEVFEIVRERFAPGAVIVELVLPDQPLDSYEGRVMALAADLAEHDVGAVGLRLAAGSADPRRLADRVTVSDAIRNELGVVTGLHGAIRRQDELVTAILSGRADYGQGRPTLISGGWIEPARAA